MTNDTLINEPVKVWAFFDEKLSEQGSSIFPIAMNWRRRFIKFEKLIFISTKKIGQTKIVDLICSAGDAFYDMEFDTGNYLWKLKKVMSE